MSTTAEETDEIDPFVDGCASTNPVPLVVTLRGWIQVVGSCALQVIMELDQLLTMDTLIYFLQAAIELLFLSIGFAYQQKAVPIIGRSRPHRHQASPQRQPRSQATRYPIWKKVRPSLNSKRPLQSKTSIRPVETEDTPRVFVPRPPHDFKVSGTGSHFSPPNITPVPVQPIINSVLPTGPLFPQPCHPSSIEAPHTSSPNLITDAKSISLLAEISSQKLQKSPRRKPVQSLFTSSTRVPSLNETHNLPFDSTHCEIIPESKPELIEEQAQQSLEGKAREKLLSSSTLVLRDSLKPERVPIEACQIVSDSPSFPGEPASNKYPLDSARSSSKKRSSPVRNSSAKFRRPPLSSSSPHQSVQVSSIASSQSQSLPHRQENDVELIQESSDTIISPIPEKTASQPTVFLFPPRPAVALVQTPPGPSQPNLVSDPVPEVNLTLSTTLFELPLPPNPRQPPPPPAIPRFPSTPKLSYSIATTLGTEPTSPHSESCSFPVNDNSVIMSTVTILPDSHPLPSENLKQNSATNIPPEIFSPGWDPSQDDNIFSPNSSNVRTSAPLHKSDESFLSHESVGSNSSVDFPQNDDDGTARLSSPHLWSRSQHSRTASNQSVTIPSPVPSPRIRPRSVGPLPRRGSVGSSSDLPPPAFVFDNTHLKPGNAAALLSHVETLNLYRQNVKKAVDNPATQYEFAVFLMDSARESALDLSGVSPTQRDELLKEGLSILRRLADRGYPQAQYYLADCYSNGIGCRHNAPDLEKAFPLFVLAAKHGHIEASFRTALAYENGWGCRREPFKALQFLRKAASANHPGAMLRLGKACLNSEFGMPNTPVVTVEGVNWLKRAVEAATPLYPNAPYELALLHEFGYQDIVFPDEGYAVQLFAKASDLGHPDAACRLGEAYEYGRMGCPEDPGLSVHYYSLAARGGNASAMLSLCAWYMVGAEGVLEKSDEEAFAWAHRAAQLGLAKAEFATGYFLERGVGCRRDPLEAWKYYVRAADHGDDRAIVRLRAGKDLNTNRSAEAMPNIDSGAGRSSLSGSDLTGGRQSSPHKEKVELEEETKPKDKECTVM